MKQTLAILLYLCTALIAFGESISVSTRTPLPIVTDPRQTITVVFTLSNETASPINAFTTLELPPGWSTISAPSLVSLQPGGKGIAIVSFFVPFEAAPGKHRLNFVVANTADDQISGSYAFEVEVSPQISLEVNLWRAPRHIVAGETSEVLFVVANKSNTALVANLKIKSSLGFGAEIEGIENQRLPLQVQEHREITVRITSKEAGTKIAQYRLELQVTPESTDVEGGKPSVYPTSVGYCKLEVIPGVSKEKPMYHTLPIQVTAGHSEVFGNGWQGEIDLRMKGGGYLDEFGKHRVDFTLHSILDLPGISDFGTRDRYSLSYRTGLLAMDLGDAAYNLSPVLGNCLSGRGIASFFDLNRFDLGLIYLFKPYENPVSHHVAFTSAFHIPNHRFDSEYLYRLNLNVVSTLSENVIVDLSQVYQPTEEISFVLDGAAATAADNDYSGSAYFAGTFRFPVLGAALSLRYGSPTFPGPYRDCYNISGHVTGRIIPAIWNIKSGYSQMQKNLLLADTQSSASLTREYYLGTQVRFPALGTNLIAQWNIKTRTDRMPVPEHDTLENTFELSVAQPIHSVNLRGRGNWAITNDALIQDISVAQYYSTALRFDPSDAFSGGLFVDFDGMQSDFHDDIGRLGFGFDISHTSDLLYWKLSNTNGFDFRDGEYEGFSLSATGTMRLNIDDRNELSADIRFELPSVTAKANPEFTIGVGYHARLDVPVGRLRNVGTLEGTITMGANLEPVKNVILRVADRAVISDENGNYRISTLPEGEYLLEVDASRVGLHLIPNRELPIRVTVSPSQTETVDITIIEGGVIEGSVTLYAVREQKQGLRRRTEEQDAGSYSEVDLIADSGFPNVLMQIEKDGEIRRTITDRNGNFSFTDILPGAWVLSVAGASLPQFHEFVESSLEFEIRSGDREHAALKIYPVKRPVTLITPGSTITVTVREPEPEPPAIVLQSATASVTDFNALAKELRKAGLPRNYNKPKLLNLEWGSTLASVDAHLLGLNRDFSALKHLSERGTSEDRDLQTEPTVRYIATGIGHYDLESTLILTFLNPKQDKSSLLLSGAEIYLSANDVSEQVIAIETAFAELAGLFCYKWRIPMTDVERRTVISSGTYLSSVNDVSVAFRITENRGEIRLDYTSDWFARILERAIPVRSQKNYISSSAPVQPSRDASDLIRAPSNSR